MEMLSREFAAPPARNKVQWKKVEFLVRNGFRFYSVFETIETGVMEGVNYPSTFQDALVFVEKYKSQVWPPESE